MKIFENLRIIELASVLAGPSVGMFFAELGAKVIKFENKLVGGDVTRNWKIANEDEDSVSAYFSSVNYNKELILVDYNNSVDIEKVKSELISADIVICNFKDGYAEKFGLDYKTLNKSNPSLIYAQLNGFESTRDRVAFDVVLQAECGYMYMNGQKDSPPTKLPLAFMDILAAHQLKEGILTALYQKSITNKGCFVSTSLEESAIASLANQASNFLMVDQIPKRIGSLHPNIAPYGEVFETLDNELVVLAIGSDKQFENLCKILNTSIFNEIDYSNNSNRVNNRVSLEKLISPFIKSMDSSELLSKCQELQVPIGKIKNMKQVFEEPLAQKMILTEKIEETITKRVKSVAFTIQD